MKRIEVLRKQLIEDQKEHYKQIVQVWNKGDITEKS